MAGDLRFYIHHYLEQVYGRVDLGAHRLDSPQGLLRYACAFVNEQELAFRGFVWAESESAEDQERAKAMLAEVMPEQVEVRRAELRTIFEAAMTGEVAALDFRNQPDGLLESINKRRKQGIDWIVSVDRGVGDRVYGKIWLPDAFVSVIMSMLLNEEHRDLLCRCRSCEDFFVAKQKGNKPRTLYCDDECMKEANDANGATRQRNRYKRQRATEILIRQKYGLTSAKETVKAAFKRTPEATAEQLAEHATRLIQAKRKQK